MSNLWNYFNSPELVFQVQNFFGIEKVDKDEKKYRIKNKFFYYLFLIGTELGDGLFYGIFIPFCFFNLDGLIARRFVFNWFVNMYVGQALKEFFISPRPKSPAIQMQQKWSNEYSLPSTHAMSSPSIAVSIVYFAIDRYEVNLVLCTILTILWISIVSWSRVYLGMHSVLDLIVGFILSAILLIFLLPVTNAIEIFLATHQTAPLVLITMTTILMVYFPIPRTKLWTPTKGDTISIAGVFLGIEIGHWVNYQNGYLNDSNVVLPLAYEMANIYSVIIRTMIGLAVVAASEYSGKYVFNLLLCTLTGKDKGIVKSTENSLDNSIRLIDLGTKYLTYSLLGFNTLFLAPKIFQYFNIQRDSFYTEI